MVLVHTPGGQGIEIDPDLNTIWRFMNFGEFTSLLLNGLFFSSCKNYAEGDDSVPSTTGEQSVREERRAT